ncbi:MAG: MotA/TolQ/ExbB proton channel family protein [Myxococcales bacterium]|nr:MotA/TolQ/ExbB proton channel family protein [Myxococcales bacterium]
MNIVDQMLKIALLGSEWVLWLLIVLSVLSLSQMAERWWFFRKNERASDGVRDALTAALLEGGHAVDEALAKFRCVETEVLRAAWKFRVGGSEGVTDAIESEMAVAREKLESGMTFLGTIGNNAPFIGLLGTVIGVIEAFEQLGAGDDAAMGRVMSLIAEALVATGVGIFVAIPAVVAYNVAQSRIAAIEGETAALGKLMSAWLRSNHEAPSPATAAAPSPIALHKRPEGASTSFGAAE